MTQHIPSALIAGCGYLGLRAATCWQRDAVRTTAITRSTARAAEFQELGLQPLLLDLSHPAVDAVLPRADVALWAVGFDRSFGVDREQIWLDGLRWLIAHLPSAPRRFLYVSSTSVYGQVDGESVDERTLPSPTTEGGKCCAQAEELARAEFSDRFPETQVVILRMAGIYGPDRLLRRVDDLRNRTRLSGRPDHWLNLIHVDDAVRLVQHASTAVDIPDVINVVNSETVTRREYYSRLADLVGAPPPIFDDSENSTGHQRGGNKRVTSCHACASRADFKFEDVLQGLDDAVRRTIPDPGGGVPRTKN